MLKTQTTRTPFCPKLETYSATRYDRPCFVDAKLDGEYAAWFINGIYGKTGTKRSDFPASDLCLLLAASLAQITVMSLEEFELLGELHFGDSKAGDLYKLLANKTSDDLRLSIFDFYAPRYPSQMIERRELLVHAFSNAFCNQKQNAVQLVPFKYCEAGEIEESIVCFTDNGYEGAVIKPVDAWIPLGFKFKSKQTADLRVLSADPWRDRIGIEHPFIPGKELCGVKISNQNRQALVGRIVEIEYLQKFHNQDGQLTSLRNPVFLRVRDDKSEVSL